MLQLCNYKIQVLLWPKLFFTWWISIFYSFVGNQWGIIFCENLVLLKSRRAFKWGQKGKKSGAAYGYPGFCLLLIFKTSLHDLLCFTCLKKKKKRVLFWLLKFKVRSNLPLCLPQFIMFFVIKFLFKKVIIDKFLWSLRGLVSMQFELSTFF